jgi:hypothetical protein
MQRMESGCSLSSYIAKRIEKPKHFHIAPLLRGRGKRAVQVIGFDSEQDTRNARPMLFQFSRSGDENDVDLRRIPPRRHAALDVFMSYLWDYCTRKDTEYIVVGFNLKYEFTQLFGELPTDLMSLDEYEFRYELRDVSDNLRASYVVRVMSDKRYGVTIMNETTHRRVKLIDAAAFYPTQSLDSVSQMLGIGRKEIVKDKRFTLADLDSPAFLKYARQDAWLTRKIGEYVMELHATYDVPTCITAPHFAARVFRRHFLHREIPLPDPELEQAGLFSYHGGKNGYYLAGPKSLANVYAYDITSAYPEAMRALPNIENGEWHWTDRYEPGAHALWKIAGDYKSCKYRGIMRHENEWHETGPIADTWTTSYELDAAIAEGEMQLTACVGWIFRGEPGGPLTEYVDRFFEAKRTAVGAARHAFKLFLNSLYGKFFQKVPLGIVGYYDAENLDDLGNVTLVQSDPSALFDYQAGGLYHPPIASLITGFVRAKIHRLEHKYDAVMTSTDGFFAMRKPDPADVGKHLGGLTVERGHLSIWRERLYDFRPRGNGSAKFALHGFRGKLDELRRIPLRRGAYTYNAVQVITNKLSLKSYRGNRFAPGTFATLQFTLDLTESRAGP